MEGFFTFWWDATNGKIWLQVDKFDKEFGQSIIELNKESDLKMNFLKNPEFKSYILKLKEKTLFLLK